MKNGLDDLPFYLVRAAVAFRRLNDCALRQVGMKSQPLGAGSVLHTLFEHYTCTVKALAKRTLLPNGTLTGVLDGLEREGLIRRVKNAHDGRSWLVQLTAKGKAVRETVMKRHKIIVDLFDETISPQETELVKRVLQRLAESMDDYVGTRAARSLKTGGAKSKPVKRPRRRPLAKS
jgi:DNA-binding MarR family transcriptional regulator